MIAGRESSRGSSGVKGPTESVFRCWRWRSITACFRSLFPPSSLPFLPPLGRRERSYNVQTMPHSLSLSLVSLFVRSPTQRWKKSSPLNLEQSRPTSYGILLFYNCVLDYDKGDMERGREESPFLLPLLFFFFLLLPFLFLALISISVLYFSLSLDRIAGWREWNEDSSRFFVFSLSLFLLTLPLFESYISADKWGEKKMGAIRNGRRMEMNFLSFSE